MSQLPPPGQDPIDPQGVFRPPPLPGQQGTLLPPPAFPPPPQMMYPPPAYGYPPQQPTFARKIFLTLATSIFGLSLAANLYLLMMLFMLSPGGGSAKIDVLVKGEPTQKIAILPISGIIMSEMSTEFYKYMEQVDKDPNIKALVLHVNSPGGSVGASDQIHHRILQFRKAHPDVPVVVAMAELATSGGYYVSAPADYIFAEPTTLTGNIGVLAQRLNLAKLAQEWGIEDTSLHSTGADYKTAGSPLRPETPEERAYIQKIIDDMFVKFKKVVTDGRKKKLTAPIEEIASGKAYTAGEAIGFGLVDQEGYLEDAYNYAATKAGLKNPTVVRYSQPAGLLEMLSAGSRLPAISTDGSSVSLQGAGMKLEAERLYDLTRPKLLYLWRGQ